MNYFINDSWIFLGLSVLWILLKLFKFRLSLWIALAGVAFFTYDLINSVSADDLNLWPAVYLGILLLFLYQSWKQVQFKTQTAVFDEITRQPIEGAVLHAGTHFVDTLLEKATVSVDGEPNISADLQELKVEVEETPMMQTKTRGVQAKVMDITFMLKLTGNISRLFDIEGGAQAIRERIDAFTLQFLHGKIAATDPETLDQGKEAFLVQLAKEFKTAMNNFCNRNRYPYQIEEDVTVGDTELEPSYYEILRKKAYAVLEQDANDEVAKRLRDRLLATGRVLRPTGTEKDKIDAALVALSIVPRNIKENKLAIDGLTATLIRDIAMILKKK